MIVLKLILLTVLFLGGNSIVGMLLLAMCGGRQLNHETDRNGLAKALLAGTGFLFILFGVLTFFVIFRGAAFAVLSKAFIIIYLCMLVGSVVVLLAVKRFRGFVLAGLKSLKSKAYWKEQCLWITLFLLIAVTFFIHRPYLESRFDLPERMSTLEATGAFSGVNPLTGQAAAELSKVQQWTQGVVPAWYLFFSNLFGIPTYRMLFQVVPLWTLCLCMSAYYLIARILFNGNRGAVRYFMIFFTLFTLCGNGAYMNPSYGLLHYGYEESTLLSSVVLPCIFALLLSLIKKVTLKKNNKPYKKKQE